MEVSRQAHGSALQASASRRSAQRVEVGEAGLEVRVKVHVEPVLCRPPPTQPLRRDMFILSRPRGLELLKLKLFSRRSCPRTACLYYTFLKASVCKRRYVKDSVLPEFSCPDDYGPLVYSDSQAAAADDLKQADLGVD